MSFPVKAETYKIATRVYRKNPYRGGVKRSAEPAPYEDTPDVYADEGDDEPNCAIQFVQSKTEIVTEVGVAVQETKVIVEKRKGKHEKHKKDKSEGDKGGERGQGSEPATLEPTEDPRVMTTGKKWTAQISIPSAFMGKLVGHNGKSRRELEDSTQCRLQIPRRHQNSPVEITSLFGLECVQRCLDRLELFLIDARKTARVTHFVALPCNLFDIIETFEIFRENVLNSDMFDESCRQPQLFPSPQKLHLTLSVLWVFDEEEQKAVSEVLKKVGEEIREQLAGNKLVAEISGIDIMNDDPKQTHVLYAKVSGEHIQWVSDKVKAALIDSGFAKKEDDEGVKLHMTVMNARYYAQANNKRNYWFDSTKILEDFSEFYFGTIPIDEIVLCPLASNNPKDQFYPKLASVSLKP